jgi:maltose O-acetyltransferase
MHDNLLRRFSKVFFKKMILKVSHKEKIDILRKKGLKIGKNVLIDPTAKIDYHNCFLISIGDNSVISAGVHLLAHDSTIGRFTGGYRRMGRIEIRENCIIGVNSVILPGVTIGPDVLVAAGSVVNKDIPPNTCVAGVPARYYGKFSDIIEKNKEDIENCPKYDISELKNKDGELNEKVKREIIKDSMNGDVFLKLKKGWVLPDYIIEENDIDDERIKSDDYAND